MTKSGLTNEALPSSIQAGLRVASAVPGVKILSQPSLIADKWAIHCSIALDPGESGPNPIPSDSEWFVLLSLDYPYGKVEVFPSKKRCIETTFQHQDPNTAGSSDVPWRIGKICLESQVQRLGRIATSPDPVGQSEDRIAWYLQRTLLWITAARTGTLIAEGDPFEVPASPSPSFPRIVHDESAAALSVWESEWLGKWGECVVSELKGFDRTIAAIAFFDQKGREVVRSTRLFDSNAHGYGARDRNLGIWWLWPRVCVLPPWAMPRTWGELLEAGRVIGYDAEKWLKQICRRIRGKSYNPLLIGYPIPMALGGPNHEIHWHAISIPDLRKSKKVRNGFRPNDAGWWISDRAGPIGNDVELDYRLAANWNGDRLQARGRLIPTLRGIPTAIIGCGSLGSLIAEMLCRGGVNDLLLIDHDTLEAGNLVRHTLSGHYIDSSKATSLAGKLATCAPFSKVAGSIARIGGDIENVEALLRDRELIIDCTGSNEAASALGLAWWPTPKLFLSASVGYRAQRTFIYAHRGHSFPTTDMLGRIGPHISEERGLWRAAGETLEGAGCWSPLFPARYDDMHMAAVACIRTLEEAVVDPGLEASLAVFETPSGARFEGFRRLENADTSEES